MECDAIEAGESVSILALFVAVWLSSVGKAVVGRERGMCSSKSQETENEDTCSVLRVPSHVVSGSM